ncbi:MAG: polyribonucleotide nucleotidyltransferase [Candidatus Paceibacterota bacterium]
MNLKNKKEFSIPFFGRTITMTVSDLAGQANAAVIGQYGDTTVLVTTVMGKEDRAIDFFPLTVDYEERFYAAGKILGSRFMRREGRPSLEGILSGRLIDRTIRPLFNERLRRDVQVVITVLSYDEQNDPDFIALLTASTALSISDIPWAGPVAGVRVAHTGKEIVINPTSTQVQELLTQKGTSEAFFAGVVDKINMIELEGREIPDTHVQNIFEEAQKHITELVVFQKTIIQEVGKTKTEVAFVQDDVTLATAVRSFAYDKLQTAVYAKDGETRGVQMKEVKDGLYENLTSLGFEDLKGVDRILEQLINEVVHINILEKEKRPDGRKIDELRPLYAEVGLLKRLHGSAVFFRGQTQSLAVTTLAAPGAEQLVETIESTSKRRFMLHYNFPPYATGEVGRVGAPGRREMGHGALAEKALRAMIPAKEVFPYTIRVVSEIVSSNGSSSMASVCAATLSLMDAGVPIEKPVAGIALGLATHQGYNSTHTSNEFKVFTDLQGFEDHYGDMDLKIAGTQDGITAIQMDLKIQGITSAIFAEGIRQAQSARTKILEVIQTAIPAPRKELSPFAPIISILQIHPEQIGLVIGAGGKTINGIIEQYGLETIDIDDDGGVFVAGSDRVKVAAAVEYIKGLTKEFVVGEVVTGEVIKLLDFGAIVDLGGGKDGMVHISEVKNGFVDKITDVLKMHQTVTAKVVKVEEGKIGLSIKAMGPATPASHTPHAKPEL